MRGVSSFVLTLPLAAAAVAAPAAPLAAQSYGQAVAVAGDRVLVGEPEIPLRSGIVFAYARGENGAWSEVGRIVADDGVEGDGFGSAIAADGHTVLVGAPGRDAATGIAYAFRHDPQGWVQAAALAPPTPAPGAQFGASVALAGDLALVGAPLAGDSAGAVHVFRRDGSGGWRFEATLTRDEDEPGSRFGAAVAVADDVALIGAPGALGRRARNAPGGRGVPAAAYVFRRDAAGEWSRVGLFASPPPDGEAGLGTAVALRDGRALVGSPSFGRGTGAVYVLEEEPTGEWAFSTRLLPFDGAPGIGFGSAVLLDERGALIGASGAGRAEGRIYLLRADPETGRWTEATAFAVPEPQPGQRFGGTAAAGEGVLAVTLPGDDHGAGTVQLFERGPDGAWVAADRVWSEVHAFDAVIGAEVRCDGSASVFACRDVDLLSFLPVRAIGGGRGVRLNDVWGWTDPETGREYALVGRIDGTAFVDVTDPVNPAYLGSLPLTQGAVPNIWRDIKVYANHAFIVADGAGEHGMQVFDLERLRDVREPPVTFEPDAHYDRIHSAHNIVIDPESGFAYAVGSSGGGETCGGGLHMIDIRDPKNPTFAGCFADPSTGRQRTGYTHDAQCVVYRGPDERYRERQVCFGASETALSIADVTDKESPRALAVASYPNVGYTHQGWLTEDHRHFYVNDELDELQGLAERTRTLVWNVTDLEDPILVAEHLGTTAATDHNLYVVGDRMYQSNYVAGLRVLDISDRESPREVAFFDTVPYGEIVPGFAGSWSNYPFFRSGTIAVTSMREGLFLLRLTERRLVP